MRSALYAAITWHQSAIAERGNHVMKRMFERLETGDQISDTP